MAWWLTVFFLIGNQWIPGRQIDGWGPRSYENKGVCEERLAFAEEHTRNHPLAYETMWVCTPGRPATEAPALARRD